jgi:acetyl esterase/lipase
MKKLSVLLFFALITSACAQKNRQADTSWIKSKFTNISYASISEAQKLDIYLPETVSTKLPVIVSIHGGAFMFGDKADNQVVPMLEGVIRGYAVISINYRLSGESKFPSQINDVKTAIRWIKANAAKYNLDPDRIALWGGSAGGNLAALAGTSSDIKELDGLNPNNSEYTSNVQAVVDWFGPINFLEMDKQFAINKKGEANHNDANSPESKLVGNKITLAENLVQKANPETYISSDDPHFFIQHGTEDERVPTQQSINFYNKLVEKVGKEKVSIELLQGAKHGGEQFESKENLNKVFQFLDAILKIQ